MLDEPAVLHTLRFLDVAHGRALACSQAAWWRATTRVLAPAWRAHRAWVARAFRDVTPEMRRIFPRDDLAWYPRLVWRDTFLSSSGHLVIPPRAMHSAIMLGFDEFRQNPFVALRLVSPNQRHHVGVLCRAESPTWACLVDGAPWQVNAEVLLREGVCGVAPWWWRAPSPVVQLCHHAVELELASPDTARGRRTLVETADISGRGTTTA